MIRSRKLTLTIRTTAALLLVACTSAAPAAGPGVPTAAQPRAVAAADLADQIAELAVEGKFDELGHVLTTVPADAQVTDLAEAIQAYEQHLETRREAKRAAHDEAVAEALKNLDEGKLEDALVKVIEAHSLAEDPDALLGEQRIAGLTQTVADQAKASEAAGDWVEAVSLYRLLDLLYEDTRVYKQAFERTATHIRVLQLYNPQLLRGLYKQRAQRLGNEEEIEIFEEADDQELEDWNIKLAGIDQSMLSQTFSYAATRHVDKEGYTALTRGAVEGLSVMIATEGIETVFPGLADDAKRARMREKLDAVKADLDRPGRRLTRGTAMALIDEVIQTNKITVGLPENVVLYELTAGATGDLDQFSAVIWPEELKQFARSISGNFVGVGVQIQKLDGKLTVVTPLEGTPAMEAGLKANDIIARVDGKPTGTWSIDRAVREITGPENTKVSLTLIREGVEDPIDVTVTRKQIDIESIKGYAHRDAGGWDYWVDKDSGIGYIRMTQFLRQTAEDMDAAVAQLRAEGELKGLVLDLRFNPGGLLSTAIGVVDRFVDNGVIVSTVNADGVVTTSHSATRGNTYRGEVPLVVLINQGSASASEIVSGALQDYERATVLGENSYGKGSVQDIFPLGRGDAVFKCTTQYYQLPTGRIIHRKDESTEWGIQPDLAVEMTNKEVADWLEARRDADVIIAAEDRNPDKPQINPADILADGLDPQLEAAVLLLKAQQLSSRDELARKAD